MTRKCIGMTLVIFCAHGPGTADEPTHRDGLVITP